MSGEIPYGTRSTQLEVESVEFSFDDDHYHDERAVVLIVDRDAVERTLAREALEEAGFSVEEAEDGGEAALLCGRAMPDLVLVDEGKPDMDGLETCVKLRDLPGGLQIPIVLMTDVQDIEAIKRAYHVRATDFVSKPLDHLVLSHRLRYMLRANRAFRRLQRSEADLANAQRLARLGNWEWRIASNEFRASDEVFRIVGRSRGQVATFNAFLDCVHPDDLDVVRRSFDSMLYEGKSHNLDYRVLLPDGSRRFVHGQAELVPDGAGSIDMRGTIQDISRLKHAERRIEFLAYYDSLTGLPNRVLFSDRLNQALVSSKQNGLMLALMFFDLDAFKRVNDTLGHGTGDQLLKEVGRRLSGALRESDSISRVSDDDRPDVSLARLGGDEFTVLLPGIECSDASVNVARRLLAELSRPFRLGGYEVHVTASIGIAVYPTDGDTAEDLLKNADTAMYYAKNEGKNNFQFYTEEMNTRAIERLTLETGLQRALDHGEFTVYYQPKYDAGGTSVVGFEALVRWRHPEKGLLSPDAFLPVATEAGMIERIDELVLRDACTRASEWRSAGLAETRISVNLSSTMFWHRNVVEVVSRLLEESRLPPRCLELELTEGVVMQRTGRAVRTLSDLKTLGCRLSIDDFGTGYSSLSHLRDLPVDALKIDRYFVKDVVVDKSASTITRAIIALARSLDLSAVADGVETETQAAFLREHGCDELQGYFFSRPLAARAVPRFLEESSCLREVC